MYFVSYWKLCFAKAIEFIVQRILYEYETVVAQEVSRTGDDSFVSTLPPLTGTTGTHTSDNPESTPGITIMTEEVQHSWKR